MKGSHSLRKSTYPTDVVYYERSERFAGESKYPLKKMLAFAMEGITSLSNKPIKMITNLGIFVFLMSFVILIYSLVRHFMGATITGWTTIIASIWAIGGLILLSLSVNIYVRYTWRQRNVRVI